MKDLPLRIKNIPYMEGQGVCDFRKGNLVSSLLPN
jgi:hypothetical protein